MKLNLTNRRTLIESLNIEDFKIGVEVGVRTGWFTKYILDHTEMTVYAIDPWVRNAELMHGPEECYRECYERLRPYGDRAHMVRGYSPAAAADHPDNSIDFVYIDGLHDYESVKADIAGWWPKVRAGGVLAGHDFNKNDWPGVVRAVEEFGRTQEVKFYLTGVVGNAFESRTGDRDEYDGDQRSWVIVKGKQRVS